MRQLASVFVISVVSSFGQVAQPVLARDSTTDQQTAARSARRGDREDFFSFITRRVNPEDIDYGTLVERRRQAFIEASAGNPYFWYSTVATLVILVGMFACGVHFLDARRKLWHATEMATDFWNDAQYARCQAQAAIDRYNAHIEDCNRVIETQLSGRASSAALEADDFQKQLERVRAERDNLESENKRLKADLERSNGLMDSLSARVNNLEPKVAQSSGGNSAESDGKLVAKVNSLQQQLETERQQNRRLRGA